MLYPVITENIYRVWPSIEKYVDRVLDKSPIPLPKEKLYLEVLEDRMKLFLLTHGTALKGMVIFRVEDHLGINVLNAYAMSYDSDYEHFNEDLKQVDIIAELLGCEYVIGYGRRGFAKTMIPSGFKHMQTVMVRKIGD